MKQERIEFGRGYDDYTGAAMRPNPASWRDVYKKAYGEEPKSAPLAHRQKTFFLRTQRRKGSVSQPLRKRLMVA